MYVWGSGNEEWTGLFVWKGILQDEVIVLLITIYFYYYHYYYF